MSLNIVFPVLNEQNVLKDSILKTMNFLEQNDIDFIITIADNGSSDDTQSISKDLAKNYEKIEYLRISTKGVGIAFFEAIMNNSKREKKADFIGYMDIDLSTDLSHLKEVYTLLKNGEKIVVGSRLLKDSKVIGRSFKRKMTSRILNIILKLVLRVKFSDAMCGFKFYQAKTAEFLISKTPRDNGWFYCASMLIFALKYNIKIKEIPIHWSDDSNSKVRIIPLALNYLKQIFILFKLQLKDKNPLNAILIGRGEFGSKLKAYIQNDTRFNLLNEFGKDFNANLISKNTQIAFIATNLDSHFLVAKTCLENDLDIFIEKPTTKNLNQFLELVNLANMRNKKIYTDYIYLCSPSIKMSKNLLQEKIIKSINSTFNQYGKFYENENVLEIIGVHFLSIFIYLFGEVKLQTYEIKNNAESKLILKANHNNNEFLISLNLSLDSKIKQREIKIDCLDSSIIFNPLESITLQTQSKQFAYNEKDNIKNTLDTFINILNDENLYKQHLDLSYKVMEIVEKCNNMTAL